MGRCSLGYAGGPDLYMVHVGMWEGHGFYIRRCSLGYAGGLGLDFDQRLHGEMVWTVLLHASKLEIQLHIKDALFLVPYFCPRAICATGADAFW